MTKEQLNIVQDIFRFCVNARNNYEGLTCGDVIFALSTIISDFIMAGVSDTEEAKEMLQKELDKIMTMFSADDIDRCQSCMVRDECIWDTTRKT